MSELLVGIPESDGSLYNSYRYRIYLIKNPTITSISPTRGFANQNIDIRITGTNFLNLETLHVKGDFVGNTPSILIDCLIISNEVIIVSSPNAMDIALYNDRTMTLSVSTNGFDYSETNAVFTFMDEPHMISMTEVEADYDGNVATEIIGLHFTSDVNYCVFGTLKVDATYNSTTGNIMCTAPPYDKYGNVQMKLVFFDNYIVNTTLLYFKYVSLNIIDDFNPKEGHVDGGLLIEIQGNFTILANQTFELYFGTTLATNVTMVSNYLMNVITPAVNESQDVLIYIYFNGDVYDTGSQYFSYKIYFKLLSVYPTSGPSRGNSVVQFNLDDSIYGTQSLTNF